MGTMIYNHPISKDWHEVGHVGDNGVIYSHPIKTNGYEVGCVKNNVIYYKSMRIALIEY